MRAGAPDVAPSKESAADGDTAAAKRIRKNTWADLEARYQQIKGEAYVRPPKQKVGEFQLMVEGLEARTRGAQEPAQAKDHTRPPIDNPPPPIGQLNSLIPESMANGLQLLQQLQLFFTAQAKPTMPSAVSSQAKEAAVTAQATSGDNNGEGSDEEGVEVFI